MTINRRTLLAAASGFVLSPAFAQEAPPALAAYERETGGRIGLATTPAPICCWHGPAARPR